MTIKQQGGIFGRNPTFNNVDANTVITNELGVGTSPLTKVHVSGVGEIIRIEDTDATLSTNQTIGKLEYYSNDASGAGVGVKASIKALAEDSIGRTSLVFSIADASSNDIEGMRLNSSGNLAFPSGQGIDFSATSGTGTSELFDDYEEGTFTCTDASGGGNAIVTNYAAYTKIGNAVTISLYITVPAGATGSGALLGGLPYAPSTYNNILVAQNTGGLDIIAKTNIGGFFVIYPSGSASNSVWSNLAGDDVYITGTYYV